MIDKLKSILDETFPGVSALDFSDDDAADLDDDGDDQYQSKLPENLMVKIDQEGFDNVAGQHQVDDQIVDVLLSGGADNADLFDQCSDEDQKEHGNLQYKYVAHDVCLFSVKSRSGAAAQFAVQAGEGDAELFGSLFLAGQIVTVEIQRLIDFPSLKLLHLFL